MGQSMGILKMSILKVCVMQKKIIFEYFLNFFFLSLTVLIFVRALTTQTNMNDQQVKNSQ